MSVAQINAALQSALASIGYPSGNTTSAQLKQEANTILSYVTAANKSIQALPTSNITATQILAIVPQLITLAVAGVKATYIVKKHSSPFTPEEGNEFLAIIQKAQAQLVQGLNACAIRVPAAEAAIPGISKFGLSAFKSVIDPLIPALIAAAPPNIPKSTVQELQSGVDVAYKNVLARVPA